jgi:pSer/pThr/pTyr-binding forkhead associated (FHA) protein
LSGESHDHEGNTMEVQLKVLVGSSAGQTIKVPGPKFYIGRSEDCQLRPKSDLISRHHCAIIVEGDYVAVRDFGSKNGTYVNDERVSSERELKPGDHLKVGPLEFEIVYDLGSLGGPKRSKVGSIKEAAARTADSGVVKKPADDPDGIDLSEWLGEDLVNESDTREMHAPTESTEIKLDATGSGEHPVPPPKPDDSKSGQKNSSAGSDEAAAEMLRKLRRFR